MGSEGEAGAGTREGARRYGAIRGLARTVAPGPAARQNACEQVPMAALLLGKAETATVPLWLGVHAAARSFTESSHQGAWPDL